MHVELAFITGSPMVDSEAQTIAIEIPQLMSDAFAVVLTSPGPQSASQTKHESITPAEVVPSVLADVTTSSSKSAIEVAVDITVSFDSAVEVTLEAGDAMAGADKDFEIL